MGTAAHTLQVELEHVGRTSWWAGVLAALTLQGDVRLRFVGRVDGERRYRSTPFSCPRTLGHVPPREAWAPGLTSSLEGLQRELEDDGWVLVGEGHEPWDLRYERKAARPSRRV